MIKQAESLGVDINTINFVLSALKGGVEAGDIISQLVELGRKEEEVDVIFSAAKRELARRQEEGEETSVEVPTRAQIQQLQQAQHKGDTSNPAEPGVSSDAAPLNEEEARTARLEREQRVLQKAREAFQLHQEGKSPKKFWHELGKEFTPEEVNRIRLTAGEVIKQKKPAATKLPKADAIPSPTSAPVESEPAIPDATPAPAGAEQSSEDAEVESLPLPTVDPKGSEETDGKPEIDKELVRKHALRILKYRTMGVSDEDIRNNLEEAGLDEEIIRESMKLMGAIDKGRTIRLREKTREEKRNRSAERKENRALGASIGQVETRKGAAYKLEDEQVPLGRERIPIVPADEGPMIQVETRKPGDEPAVSDAEPESDVDTSGVVNPFMLKPDAQADLDALVADVHASVGRPVEVPPAQVDGGLEISEQPQAARLLEKRTGQPEKLTAREIEDLKRSYDPMFRLLKRMSGDPDADFKVEDAHINYRVFIPVRDDKGVITGHSEQVQTYHDLMQLRAAIPEELKRESDHLVWNWQNGNSWGKIATFADTEKLWNRFDNPNDKLSKYRDEAYVLVDQIQNELLPDEYAEAVERGEIQFQEIPERDIWRAYTEIAAMYGDEFMPSAVREKYRDLQKKLSETEYGSDEFRAASKEILALVDEQWQATAEKRAANPIDFDTWSARLNAFENQHQHASYEFRREFSKALNAGDEAKMTEISAAADASFAEQRAAAEHTAETTPEEAQEGLDNTADQLDTPLEWRNKLKSLIEGAKSKMNAGERSEKMKRYLAERAGALGEKAKEYGPRIEEFIRAKGEEYNKLSFTKKLLIGGVLGVGAAVSAGVSTPLAAAFAINLGLQRFAGMSSMFLKIENYLQDHRGSNIGMGPLRIRDERIKEAAAFGAVAYTALMGVAIGESVHLASESAYGQAVREWLGNMLGHQTGPSGVSEKAPAPAGETSPSSPSTAPEAVMEPPQATSPAPASVAQNVPSAPSAQPAATAAAGEAITAGTPEVGSIEVKAAPGKGYEYMTKRLWEQLQEKNITLPSGANPDSDLAKLLAADKDSIDKVVHQLAQENEFFKNTGQSVRIDLDSHMTIDAKGNISITGSDLAPEGTNLAPEGSPLTPPYQHGAPHPEAPAPVPPTPDIPAATEGPAGIAGTTATETTVEQFPSPDILIETQSPAPVIDRDFVVNKFDVTVPLAEPHIYAGPPGTTTVFAYGGEKMVRLNAMFDYLKTHPDSTVIAEDDSGKYRAAWTLVKDRLVQGERLPQSGFFGRLSGALLPPPGPDELSKLIK